MTTIIDLLKLAQNSIRKPSTLTLDLVDDLIQTSITLLEHGVGGFEFLEDIAKDGALNEDGTDDDDD